MADSSAARITSFGSPFSSKTSLKANVNSLFMAFFLQLNNPISVLTKKWTFCPLFDLKSIELTNKDILPYSTLKIKFSTSCEGATFSRVVLKNSLRKIASETSSVFKPKPGRIWKANKKTPGFWVSFCVLHRVYSSG